MSFRLIRMCCIGALISIILSLGIMLLLVADRVDDFETHIARSVSQLTKLRQIESNLQQVLLGVDRAIDEYESNVNPLLEKLDILHVTVEITQKPSDISPSIQLDASVKQFQHNLRLLKVALINYVYEVNMDPSADTTSGLEAILVDLRDQSARFFNQLSIFRIEKIKASHDDLEKFVRRTQSISFMVLLVGLGLGLLLAVILTKALNIPISKLIEGTTELGKGNFDFKVQINSQDEMGHLAKSFNSMIAELKEKNSIKAQLELTQYSVDHASAPVFWIEKDGTLSYANYSASKKLGYDRKELLRHKIFDIDSKLNQDIWLQIWKDTQTNKHSTSESYYLTSRNELFPVEIVYDFLEHDGREYLCTFVIDCTERREAEKARLELESHSQRAEKMEAIGAVAGGVAHDLNNILSGIVSYPELLLMKLPDDDPMRMPLITIQKTGIKAATIVQDLLTLSRRGVTVRDVIQINSVVEEYLLSPEYRTMLNYHKNVTLEAQLAPDLLNILGSPVHIYKTVMNLVSNAAEAMPDGGPIIIRTENRYIDQQATGYEEIPEGEYSLLSISDSGVGMMEEEKQKIFEPFYTKKVMGRSGTGLGMAVVWGTVKDHNGIIDLKSEPGTGTEITLFFPVSRNQEISRKTITDITDYIGNGEVVLIVDDISEQREIASAMLTQLGYYAHAVSSGEQAIVWLKKHSADIILLDMIMEPGIDGITTYNSILTFRPNQLAIIASGYSENEKVRQVQESGVQVYVQKPYSLSKLGQALKKTLRSIQ